MSVNLNVVKGNLRAVGNRVLVSDMHFGSQTTKSGLIINSDDGKTRGIYPRWGKVYAKGPDNKDDYKIGDWILVEHGRWTRGIDLDDGQNKLVVRMVEAESVLAYSAEKPNDVYIGAEFSDGQGMNIRPDDFVRT